MKELEIIDFESVSKRLILSQYKNKPNMGALMRIISNIFSDMQDQNFDLRDKFWLEDATGEQLDFIGALWDVPRAGKNDSEYRMAIYQKIGLTLSGTIPEIKALLTRVYGGTFAIYSPEYPAGYRMRTNADVDNEILEEATAAGVQGFLAGKLLDAQGNNIVSVKGDKIIHVSTAETIAQVESGGSLYGESLYGSSLYGGI